MKKNPLVSSLLKEFATELGFELLIEPEFGYAGRIKTKTGKIYYFHGPKFDINNLGASAIAKDKTYASFFMKQLGYPIPEGDVFYSEYWSGILKSEKNITAALAYAESMGFPLIIKPNSESQGRGVDKVHTEDEMKTAFSTITDDLNERVVIVQQVAPGKDYRIVVLNDDVICAYLRIPLSVVGDDKSTVAELLKTKQAEFIIKGRDTTINLEDPRIIRSLSHQGATIKSILEKGKVMQLLANANLSSGGEAEDVTDLLHPDYKKMAVQLTHDMGLSFSGIDIMTPRPITEPLSDYVVIEINAAPGLDYYAESGEKQREIVKNLYRKLVQSLIVS